MFTTNHSAVARFHGVSSAEMACTPTLELPALEALARRASPAPHSVWPSRTTGLQWPQTNPTVEGDKRLLISPIVGRCSAAQEILSGRGAPEVVTSREDRNVPAGLDRGVGAEDNWAACAHVRREQAGEAPLGWLVSSHCCRRWGRWAFAGPRVWRGRTRLRSRNKSPAGRAHKANSAAWLRDPSCCRSGWPASGQLASIAAGAAPRMMCTWPYRFHDRFCECFVHDRMIAPQR